MICLSLTTLFILWHCLKSPWWSGNTGQSPQVKHICMYTVFHNSPYRFLACLFNGWHMLAKYATYRTEGNEDCYIKVDEQTRYHRHRHSFQQNHKVGRVTCVWPARRQTCHSRCCILAFMALLCIALHIWRNTKHCGDFFLIIIIVLQNTIKWGAGKNNSWQWQWQRCFGFTFWCFILL